MKERIDAIIVMCCIEFGTSPKELFSPCRNTRSYRARAASAMLLRTYCFMSQTKIAELLQRDPSTINNSINSSATVNAIANSLYKVEMKLLRTFQLKRHTL